MMAQNLWRWDGTAGRSRYLTVGSVAFALKLALDYFVVSGVFHRSWSLLFYWRPFGAIRGWRYLDLNDAGFAAVMLTVALPFLWLGLAMTAKRLRDAGQPVWLACLFFVPWVNLLFFATLCLLPSSQTSPQEEAAPWPGPRVLDPWIPRSAWGNALLTVAITTLIGLSFTLLGTKVLRTYGFGLFVAMPFCMGLFAVLLHSYHQRRDYAACLKVALLPIGILSVVLLGVAIEGIICLLMAAPLALLLALLGGSLGYAIQTAHWGRASAPAMMSIVILALPAGLGYEHGLTTQPSTFRVESQVVINAVPEVVWKNVVAFADLAPPGELLFRAGVAYPVRAEIAGRGAGAVRRCVFSTGAFVEPIEVWDEPRLLRFSVAENPPPLNELTPYGHIEPAHLHGYFTSHQGQFLLTALPDGKTLLSGTTWYTNAMWPEQYWRLWSDHIIHRIHMRVLANIREKAERPAETSLGAVAMTDEFKEENQTGGARNTRAEQNTKTILAIFRAIEERDNTQTAGLFQPDFEIRWPASLPYGGTVRGLTARPNDWSATWEPLQPMASERKMDPRVVAVHGDELVVLWHQRGRSPSGETLDAEVLGLYRFREGKLARAQMFYFDSIAVAKFLDRAKGSLARR